jgi:hypothetical protein
MGAGPPHRAFRPNAPRDGAPLASLSISDLATPGIIFQIGVASI